MSLQLRNVAVYPPYTFCERCVNADIDKLYERSVDGKGFGTRVCKYQSICTKTVQLVLDTIDKGEPLR